MEGIISCATGWNSKTARTCRTLGFFYRPLVYTKLDNILKPENIRKGISEKDIIQLSQANE
jgi:hypothetical protein